MEQSTETARSLRDQYAEALITRIKASIIIDPVKQPGTIGQPLAATEYDLADAVLTIRDEEMEQLRYERRLLGMARMVLDLVAAGQPERQEQARREAEVIAQRIVDEIGHPVTDEPALGPDYRAEIERLRAAIEDVQTCWPDPFGNWSAKEAHAGRAVKEHMLRKLNAALAATEI